MPVRLKTTPESRANNVTLTDDTDLAVTLAASTTYFVDVILLFEAGATPDIKFHLSYTGTLTSAVIASYIGNARDDRTTTGGAEHRTIRLLAANLTTPVTFTLAGNDTAETVGICNYRGVIRTNSTGTLKIMWAQLATSGTNTTVLDGSYIRYDTQADMPGHLLVKTATTSRASNVTSTPDPDLQFQTVAGGEYICEMGVTTTCGPSTTGLRKRLSDTGVDVAVGYITQGRGGAAGTEPSTAAAQLASAFRAALINTPVEDSPAAVVGLPRWLEIHWSMIEGSSGEQTLAYEWAQRVTNATATSVNTPSWLWYEPINDTETRTAMLVDDAEHAHTVTRPVLAVPFTGVNIIKQANETRSVGGPIPIDPDSELTFDYEADTLYEIRCGVYASGTAAGSNTRFRLSTTTPVTHAALRLTRPISNIADGWPSGSDSHRVFCWTTVQFNDDDRNFNLRQDGIDETAVIFGIIKTNTAGTISLRWGSEFGTGNLTVHSGSWLSVVAAEEI